MDGTGFVGEPEHDSHYVPLTGLISRGGGVTGTCRIPAGTCRPCSIIPAGTVIPFMSAFGSDAAANESVVVSGGTATAIAVKAEGTTAAYPDAKEAITEGLTRFEGENDPPDCFAKALVRDPRFTKARIAQRVALHNLKRLDAAIARYDWAMIPDASGPPVSDLKAVTLGDKRCHVRFHPSGFTGRIRPCRIRH